MRSSYAFLAVASAVIVSAKPLLFGLVDRSACNADSCALAVTGTNAQPASTARKSDCTSFMLHWPTGAVPTYASACSGSVGYSSACSCYGITATKNSSTFSTSTTTATTATSTSSSKSTASLSLSTNSKASSASSASISSSKSTASLSLSTSSKVSSASSASISSSKSTASLSLSTSSKASSTSSNRTTSTRFKTTSTNSNITSVTSSTTFKNSTTRTTASPTKTSTSSHSSNSTTSSSNTTTTKACSNPTCLSNAQATAVVNSFIYLLANPTASNFISTANDLLCDNFTDTSDSINSLAGIPLGQITFDNKTAFIAGSGSQSPLTLKTYDIFHSCRKIAWRWVIVGGAGDSADEVKGIDTFYTDGCGHICQIFAEFNSAAWLYNLGDPECSPTSAITFASTLTSSTASATATATNTTTTSA